MIITPSFIFPSHQCITLELLFSVSFVLPILFQHVPIHYQSCNHLWAALTHQLSLCPVLILQILTSIAWPLTQNVNLPHISLLCLSTMFVCSLNYIICLMRTANPSWRGKFWHVTFSQFWYMSLCSSFRLVSSSEIFRLVPCLVNFLSSAAMLL